MVKKREETFDSIESIVSLQVLDGGKLLEFLFPTSNQPCLGVNPQK
jgi:hypothetical protein